MPKFQDIKTQENQRGIQEQPMQSQVAVSISETTGESSTEDVITTIATFAQNSDVVSKSSIVIEGDAVGYGVPQSSDINAEVVVAEKPVGRQKESFALQPYMRITRRRIPPIASCFSVDFPRGDVFLYDVRVKMKKPAEKDEISGTKSEKYFHYGVDRKKRTEIFHTMVNSYQEFRQYLPIYDGKKFMITRRKLPIKVEEKMFVISIPVEGVGERFPEIEVVIKPFRKGNQNLSTISLEPLHQVMAGYDIEVSKEAMVALNTILRYGPSLRYIPIGKWKISIDTDKGNSQRVRTSKEKRKMWLDYSVVSHWKPCPRVDISDPSFCDGEPVLNFMSKCLKKDVEKVAYLTVEEISGLTKQLQGLQVATDHVGREISYRIKLVTEESADNNIVDFMEHRLEQKISVTRYMKKRYEIELKFPNLPCLLVVGNKRRLLPVELCNLSSSQPASASYINREIVLPSQGSQKDLNITPNRYFVPKWAIVNFSQLRDEEVEDFSNCLCEKGKNYHLELNHMVEIKSATQYDYKTIRNILETLKSQYEDVLVVVVLPDAEQPLRTSHVSISGRPNETIVSHVYYTVKEISDILNIVTQCVIPDNVRRNEFKGKAGKNLCLKIKKKLKVFL